MNCSTENSPSPSETGQKGQKPVPELPQSQSTWGCSVTLSKNLTEFPSLWLLAGTCVPSNRSHPEAIDFRRKITSKEA